MVAHGGEEGIQVIPVVDLRTRFGFPEQPDGARTCVIVVEVATGAATSLCGVVVDAVLDVLHIPAHDIEEMPNLGGHVDAACVRGIAKVKDGVRILLDLDVALGEIGLAA